MFLEGGSKLARRANSRSLCVCRCSPCTRSPPSRRSRAQAESYTDAGAGHGGSGIVSVCGNAPLSEGLFGSQYDRRAQPTIVYSFASASGCLRIASTPGCGARFHTVA
jgi:hypothetical protein